MFVRYAARQQYVTVLSSVSVNASKGGPKQNIYFLTNIKVPFETRLSFGNKQWRNSWT